MLVQETEVDYQYNGWNTSSYGVCTIAELHETGRYCDAWTETIITITRSYLTGQGEQTLLPEISST